MLGAPPRSLGAGTQRQPQPQPRGARPPAWRRSVSPTRVPHAPNMALRPRGSAPMAGEGRRARSPPGGRSSERGPQGRRPSSACAAHRGPRSPARLGSEPSLGTPRKPSATKGRKVTWGSAGGEGRASRGAESRLALASCSAVRRRLRAGGSRSSGLPRPPLQEARRLGGAAAGPTPRLGARGGGGSRPRPGFPPAADLQDT